jgi:OmcA/MtrC family decaheme c-type cytochrome
MKPEAKPAFPFRILGGVAALVVAAVVVSAPQSPFTTKDKAFYADANTINFVRPGLNIQVTGAEIAADGTIRARVKLTDPRGLPLDRLGVETPGPVSVSLVAATIPKGQNMYTAYTTRVQTSPITGQSAVQAAADTGGTWQTVATGEYIYTFRTRAPANMDRTATHTIHAYGSRNLTEFDLGTNYSDSVYHFVPAGGEVTEVRDIIRDASCNKCHEQLAFHGGARRSIGGCITCHTPQTTDPDTGNTVDMATMIHKIHTGRNLPSVRAGGKYQIIGFGQTVHDYSKIGFSAYPDTRNCIACHEQGKGARQEDIWLTRPTRRACGSCHDTVNFATGEGHVNLPQLSDNQCATCHTPEGELEFDASIKGAHTIARFSRDLPGTVFEIRDVKVEDRRPTVTFRVTDRRGNPIPLAEMSRLFLVLAGPTTDYTTFISQNAMQAQVATDGLATFTFPQPLPEGASGTWAVGIEGYRNLTLLAGTARQRTVRDAGENKVFYFSVDGSPVAPRRQVVSLEKCNACHYFLNLHGDNRNTLEQCVLCHNPVTTDRDRRPANQMPAESVHMATMIHRIHAGKLQQRDYTIYGFGNVPHNYNDVGFPAPLSSCDMCHVNDGQQLPVKAGVQPVTDPRGLLNPVGPETAACTGCHTAVYAASHALANTTQLGESCAACHGPQAQFSVNRSHAR